MTKRKSTQYIFHNIGLWKHTFEVNSWNFVSRPIMYCSWTYYADSWILSIFRDALPSSGKLSSLIHQLKSCLSSKPWLNKTLFGRLNTWASTLSSVNHCLHNTESESYLYFTFLSAHILYWNSLICLPYLVLYFYFH